VAEHSNTVVAGSAPPPARGQARERLLAAARSVFARRGVLAATLEEVRAEAGVSVGALYHHFPDKASLVAALYVELLAQFQDGFAEQLRAHPDAEGGVRAGVDFYLRWATRNRDAAALLLGSRPRADAALDARNRAFLGEVLRWWRVHAHYGRLRDLPVEVVHALWLGPAEEYVRHWLAGRARRVEHSISAVLADAAWQSLKEEQA
jgi:AcrR family transcriptional regulator